MSEVFKRYSTAILLTFLAPCSAVADQFSLQQVLQRVIDHYPSVDRAVLQVERARQEIAKVDSQLGWQLSAQAGISRQVSVFGFGSDTLSASGSYARKLESGDTLSLDASLSHDDAETAIFGIPNPSTTTNVNLNYRSPLKKGSDNPLYEEGRLSAEVSVRIAEAEKQRLYDTLAASIIDLYLASAVTKARIENIEDSVKRTQRLREFIREREKFGIVEEKDTLQVDAQLKGQQAELSALEVAWQQQRLSMNKLTGLPVDKEIVPVIKRMQVQALPEAYEIAVRFNPEVKAADARIALADSAIRIARDDDEDQLDLVLYVGARNQSGDVAGGSSSDSDIVGGARLEFLQQQDRSGLEAALQQARLDRQAAIEDKRMVMQDLYYDIASLHAEINASKKSYVAYQKSVESEQKKLAEAEERYQSGRADTDQLIAFENQLAGSQLALELQAIELTRRILKLNLKKGMIWNGIHLPEFTGLKEAEG